MPSDWNDADDFDARGGTGALGWALRKCLICGAFGLLAVVAINMVPDGRDPADLLKAFTGKRPNAVTEARRVPATPAAASRTLSIPAGRGGHFLVDARVEGTPIRFLVDTGATGVVLSPSDARRIGLRDRDRDYTREVRTANGIVRTAPVRLSDIRIGPLTVRGVEATVNEQPMVISLLGMTFLSRLDGYEVAGDKLILRW